MQTYTKCHMLRDIHFTVYDLIYSTDPIRLGYLHHLVSKTSCQGFIFYPLSHFNLVNFVARTISHDVP